MIVTQLVTQPRAEPWMGRPVADGAGQLVDGAGGKLPRPFFLFAQTLQTKDR